MTEKMHTLAIHLGEWLRHTTGAGDINRHDGVDVFVARLPGAYREGATWLERPGLDPEDRALGWFVGRYTDEELVECFVLPEADGAMTEDQRRAALYDLRPIVFREIADQQKQAGTANLNKEGQVILSQTPGVFTPEGWQDLASRLAHTVGGEWQDGLAEDDITDVVFEWLWQKDQGYETPEEVVLRHLDFHPDE